MNACNKLNDSQLICAIDRQVVSYIERELEVPTPMEANLLAIYKDCSFVVDSAEVDQYAIFNWPL